MLKSHIPFHWNVTDVLKSHTLVLNVTGTTLDKGASWRRKERGRGRYLGGGGRRVTHVVREVTGLTEGGHEVTGGGRARTYGEVAEVTELTEGGDEVTRGSRRWR
jgi:hypothetical protein